MQIGAVRFLGDGSFLVVPGFQPGIHLFSPSGRRLRDWDSKALGIDAPDCAGVTVAEREQFQQSYVPRYKFLNQYRTVEEILPLPQGPGLLIRYVAGGKVHWVLKVLQSGERVLTYQVPFTGELPYDRLRGDVRGDRIVLLRSWHGFERGATYRPGRLFIAELPQGSGEGAR